MRTRKEASGGLASYQPSAPGSIGGATARVSVFFPGSAAIATLAALAMARTIAMQHLLRVVVIGAGR
jgi:hypothetical protein